MKTVKTILLFMSPGLVLIISGATLHYLTKPKLLPHEKLNTVSAIKLTNEAFTIKTNVFSNISLPKDPSIEVCRGVQCETVILRRK